MKNVDLKSYGVQEMNVHEVKQVDGGFVFLAFVGAAMLGGFIYDCISEPGDCINGFKAGYNYM